jgi:hypothetical protein
MLAIVIVVMGLGVITTTVAQVFTAVMVVMKATPRICLAVRASSMHDRPVALVVDTELRHGLEHL